MKIVLDPAARSEMWEAARFYDDCREGLGIEFLDAIEQAFAQINLYPLLGSPVRGRFRRVLLHRFPYAVIYSVEDDVAFVAAIMRVKRKPEYWEERGRKP